MSVAVGGNVDQPLPGAGIDDAEDRAGRHVSRGRVVIVVAGVVPGFVHEPDLVDCGENRAGGAVDDHAGWRERAAVMISATDKDVRARAEIQAGGHAIRNRETINDRRNKFGDAADADWMQRIDYIHASDGNVGRGISIGQQEGGGGGVKYHAAQSCGGYCANAARRGSGSGSAKDSAGLRGSGCGELRAMMASYIGIETSRMTGGAGRNRRTRHAGRAIELQRRIGAHESIRAIDPSVINQDGVIILHCAVVVDLADDARCVIRFERGAGATGTERIGGGDVGELGVRKAMLLRRGSSSGDDSGDVDDRNKGKSRVAVDDRNKIMLLAILRESDNTTGGGNFIAAQITAAG